MNKLTVNNLSYKYGNKTVINNISFEVNDGLIGILGPNGAGKTTIMKLITSLFAIQTGNIKLNNLDYQKDIKEIRNKLGYLPQNFNTYNSLTGKEFLEIICELKLGKDKKNIQRQIDQIVDTINLKDYINDKIKTYSGGMRQKLGFAQLLIGNPELIVIDEPTVGLDPEQRNIIRELLTVISQNRIVMVSTHITEDIELYCNHLLVIKEGRVSYNGTKNDFINLSNGILWGATVDKDTADIISSKSKVISMLQNNNMVDIKYISQEKLTVNSELISVNLQDSYLVNQQLSQGCE